MCPSLAAALKPAFSPPRSMPATPPTPNPPSVPVPSPSTPVPPTELPIPSSSTLAALPGEPGPSLPLISKLLYEVTTYMDSA
uniref:Uncharacterized protein n=1 Tax=uncultured marine virus TaxID=186617 RepID=A0A0F7L4U1_9VIRU|nr:hypothetical protein [uncultured marine virus]